MAGADGLRGPEHVVLYDGTCGFCHRTVRWIAAADPRGRFHFAPLQGSTAAALRARHPGLPTDLDSVIYVERHGADERVFVRAEAVARIAERLEPRPAWTPWLRRLPAPLRDLGYRIVARVRHLLAPAPEGACPIPAPAAHARFLP
jgi:predicted DCC family thiol-disulfide oxidoreductase YuxK